MILKVNFPLNFACRIANLQHRTRIYVFSNTLQILLYPSFLRIDALFLTVVACPYLDLLLF